MPKKLWIPDSGGHGSALGGARAEYLEQVRLFVEAREPPEEVLPGYPTLHTRFRHEA